MSQDRRFGVESAGAARKGVLRTTPATPQAWGTVIAIAGAAALILGSAPGAAWAHAYYSAVGSSIVADDIGWQELVPAALPLVLAVLAALGVVSGISYVAVRSWPLAAPWRIATGRRWRWFPGAPILIGAILGALLLVWTVVPDDPSLLASVLFGTFVVVALTAGLVVTLFFVFTAGQRLPFGDQLIETVRSIPSELSDRERGALARTSEFVGEANSTGRSLAVAALAALVPASVMTLLAALQGFRLWALWAFAAVALAMWSARMAWDLARFEHERVPSATRTGPQLDELRAAVVDADERYAMVQGAMIARIDSEIAKRGGGHRLYRLPERIPTVATRVMIVALVAFSLWSVQALASHLGERHGSELRDRIVATGETACDDVAATRYEPFPLFAVGSVEPAMLTRKQAVSRTVTECVWILRRSDTTLWVAAAISDDDAVVGVEVRPLPVIDVVSIRSSNDR